MRDALDVETVPYDKASDFVTFTSFTNMLSLIIQGRQVPTYFGGGTIDISVPILVLSPHASWTRHAPLPLHRTRSSHAPLYKSHANVSMRASYVARLARRQALNASPRQRSTSRPNPPLFPSPPQYLRLRLPRSRRRIRVACPSLSRMTHSSDDNSRHPDLDGWEVLWLG
jgi:hypothetical protein